MTSSLLIAIIALAMVAFLLIAVEIGFRVGLHTRADQHVVSHATAWEGALLGLLALLIGFTFAMAVTRFDNRRDLILTEANAIESVSLRAGYLDAPARERADALLVPYVDARIDGYAAGMDRPRTMAAYARSNRLQERLWSEVVVPVARAHPNSETISLFVEAADELIQAERRRRAALENHVPLPVFAVLLLVAATGMAATGYSCGLHRRRLPLGMVLMPVLIVLVVLVVFNLDYPRVGVIRAGQGAMLRLRAELAAIAGS